MYVAIYVSPQNKDLLIKIKKARKLDSIDKVITYLYLIASNGGEDPPRK